VEIQVFNPDFKVLLHMTKKDSGKTNEVLTNIAENEHFWDGKMELKTS
jgi:hypothetical protein